MTLISEATPDAASVCPIFALTEPMFRRCLLRSVRSVPKVRMILSYSIGSPTGVPVP